MDKIHFYTKDITQNLLGLIGDNFTTTQIYHTDNSYITILNYKTGKIIKVNVYTGVSTERTISLPDNEEQFVYVKSIGTTNLYFAILKTPTSAGSTIYLELYRVNDIGYSFVRNISISSNRLYTKSDLSVSCLVKIVNNIELLYVYSCATEWISSDGIYQRYRRYKVFNISTGNTVINESTTNEAYGTFTISDVIDENHNQLFYGSYVNNYSNNITNTYVDISKISITDRATTLNSNHFTSQAVADFNGSYWAIGGYERGVGYGNKVIKINKDNLSSELFTTFTPNTGLKPLITSNNYGIFAITLSTDSAQLLQLQKAELFNIDLYRNSAEANRVNKTDYLTAVGSLNGVMREGSSITDLSITFEMDTLPQFNYVHIPAFNRYYYVNDISSVRYRLWEMRLSVDVLMTYNDKIRALTAFVSRNQNTYNPDIVDNCIPIVQGKELQIITAEDTIFDEFNVNEYSLSIVDQPCRIVFVGTGIGLGSEIQPNQTE